MTKPCMTSSLACTCACSCRTVLGLLVQAQCLPHKDHQPRGLGPQKLRVPCIPLIMVVPQRHGGPVRPCPPAHNNWRAKANASELEPKPLQGAKARFC